MNSYKGRRPINKIPVSSSEHLKDRREQDLRIRMRTGLELPTGHLSSHCSQADLARAGSSVSPRTCTGSLLPLGAGVSFPPSRRTFSVEPIALDSEWKAFFGGQFSEHTE